MSFGLYDKDWVDPDPEPEQKLVCGECNYWIPCPCGRCGWGWCTESGEYTSEDEQC